MIIQCNPDIGELSGPQNKSLISGFDLFCLGNTGSNLGPDKTYLISGSLIYVLHCTLLNLISLSGDVANVLDCDIVVREFEFQSRYYVHFRTNALWKGMNSHILPAVSKPVPLQFFYKDGFGIK